MSAARKVRTHCCYYNTNAGSGTGWLREAGSSAPTNNSDYYAAAGLDKVAVSVATADEEDGEPPGHFAFDMRVKNVPATLSDCIFDIDVRAYLTKDELKRLHAVFGLLLGISAP